MHSRLQHHEVRESNAEEYWAALCGQVWSSSVYVALVTKLPCEYPEILGLNYQQPVYPPLESLSMQLCGLFPSVAIACLSVTFECPNDLMLGSDKLTACFQMGPLSLGDSPTAFRTPGRLDHWGGAVDKPGMHANIPPRKNVNPQRISTISRHETR
jgi:hypothetical protein